MHAMRQLLFILMGLAFFVSPGKAALQAETVPEESFDEGIPVEPESKQRPAPQKGVQPVGDTFLRDRVNDLERKVSQLEEEIGFLDERTRSLDREVDDLGRRH